MNVSTNVIRSSDSVGHIKYILEDLHSFKLKPGWEIMLKMLFSECDYIEVAGSGQDCILIQHTTDKIVGEPYCYTSNNEDYPLCVGMNDLCVMPIMECHKCNLYENMIEQAYDDCITGEEVE